MHGLIKTDNLLSGRNVNVIVIVNIVICKYLFQIGLYSMFRESIRNDSISKLINPFL